MKNFYVLILISFLFSLQSNAQSQVYSVPVSVVDTYIEDSAHVVGRLDLDFPVDGKVFIQFDGEAYGDTLDRIILAANSYPDWDSNEGNVSFVATWVGEGRCFSHTRMVDVSAGQHSFYAVAQNYAGNGGSGIASVFGTLTVEYLPDIEEVSGESSFVSDAYEVTLPIVYDSITIEASGAGKVELRISGNIEVSVGDVVMMAITDTKNWNYTHSQNIALEPTGPDENYVGLSISKVVDVPAAGSYKYYVMAQRGYEEEGSGYIYGYTNFHARFYPATSDNVVIGREIVKDNFLLDEDVRLLDSIKLNVPYAGTVEIRFDGELQSSPGHQIILAANNSPAYELQNGSVILKTTDEDIDRHTFVYTQVFDVEPGAHTYYVMAHFYESIGTTSIDLSGHFLVKYYPESVLSADENQFAELPFEIWPNPATDQVSIQFENASDPMTVSILDLQGHIVRQESNIVSGDELDASNLPSGMYIVQINNGKETGYKKLVKE